MALALEMRDISKSFPGVRALEKVEFVLEEGQIHSLLGHNGAGKSTLVRILAGIYPPASGGRILIRGQEQRFHSPKDSLKAGVSVIYQELSLIPQLSVGENIFINRLPLTAFRLVDWQTLHKRAAEIARRLNVRFSMKTLVSDLTTGEQQLVEIAKALSYGASIIVMDEPTSALSEEEVETLFATMRSLKGEGVSFIFISHRIGEVFRIADRITVLRNGSVVAESHARDLDSETLVQVMIGRSPAKEQIEPPRHGDRVFVEARNIRSAEKVADANLVINRGEVVGLAGLMGSGRTELAQVIFGAAPCDGGELWIDGHSVRIRSPLEAIRRGIGFLPEDRKLDGLILPMSVSENILLPMLRKLRRLGFAQKKLGISLIQDIVKSLQIRCSGLEQRVEYLSGGNQQKVIIARWLLMNSDLLILDEPTRGIDVETKIEIYRLVRRLAEKGTSVLLISSEFDELIRTCNRVYILANGKTRREMMNKGLEERMILLEAAKDWSSES